MANMLDTNSLRKGSVYEDGGDVLQVITYKHIKMARGQATIRVKVRNIKSGSITEKTYTSDQKVVEADVAKRTVQYLYSDGADVHFMDSEDYSQFALPLDSLQDQLGLMLEGQKVIAQFVDGEPISIELPSTVELKVIEAPEAVAGDTATNASKKVKVETGIEVSAPLFIKTGDVLKINTDTQEYISRA